MVFSYVDYLGENGTNNIAELTAILLGLQKARERGIRQLMVRSDSELSLGFCKGTKKTTKPHLMGLVQKILDIAKEFQDIHFEWVEAHAANYWNNQADALCSWMLQRANEIQLKQHKSAGTGAVAKKEKHSVEKLWLNCPFAEKEEVKQRGARWDLSKKKWYTVDIPENRERFKKWCGGLEL